MRNDSVPRRPAVITGITMWGLSPLLPMQVAAPLHSMKEADSSGLPALPMSFESMNCTLQGMLEAELARSSSTTLLEPTAISTPLVVTLPPCELDVIMSGMFGYEL